MVMTINCIAGVNPMFWSSENGGKDESDEFGAFAIATGDQRQDFDADMKVKISHVAAL